MKLKMRIPGVLIVLALILIANCVSSEEVFKEYEISELNLEYNNKSNPNSNTDNKYKIKDVNFKISMRDVEVLKTGDDDYINIPNSFSFASPGQPDLPMRTIVLTFDKNVDIGTVFIKEGKYIKLPGKFSISKAKEPQLAESKAKEPQLAESKAKESTFAEKTNSMDHSEEYAKDSYFPGKLFSYTAGKDNEHTYLIIKVFPVQYVESDKSASLINDLKFGVTYKENPPILAFSPLSLSQNIECLIILPDGFLNASNELKTLHESYGIKTEIVNISEIWNNYDAATFPPYDGCDEYSCGVDYNSTLALKIISFLNSTQNENLKHIVLFGSSNLIPPSYYAYNQEYNNYESWLPTDFFYSSPDYDLIPNFGIGRIPAKNASEAMAMAIKIKNWFNESNNGNWFNNFAVAGGKMEDDEESFIGEMSSADMINQNLFPGQSTEKFFRTDGNFTKEGAKEIFSGNFGIAYIFAHGDGKCIELDDGNFCTDDLKNLNASNKLPIIFSISCDNGAYDTELTDEEESFSESLLKSNAGGIAYFGSSRTAYYNWNIYLKNGQVKKITKKYFDNLLENLAEEYDKGSDGTVILGNMEKNAKLKFVMENDMEDDLGIRTLFGFVMLGDPALRIPGKENNTKSLDKPVITVSSNHSTGYSIDSVSTGKMPAFILNDDGIDIFCSHPSSENLELKIIDTSKEEDEVITKVTLNTENNLINFTFNPDNAALYMVRCSADDGAEGGFYFKVNEKVFFTDDYSDYGLDIDNNSLYNHLIINVSVYADEEGYYRISGSLYEDCKSGWCDSISAANNTYLEPGENVVSLVFDGREIYKMKHDGKFILKYLRLREGYWDEQDYREIAYATSFYNYSQFERASEFTGDYSDSGLDTNDNSLYDYLIINVSVYIAEEGDYRISGEIYEDCNEYYCDYITDAENETYLNQGLNIVQLKFDGEEIYKSKFNGNFVLEYLYLKKKEGYWWNTVDSIYDVAYTTSFYNYAQFEKTTSFADNYSDSGSDTNDNSLYDYLIINVSVYIEESGDYKISGELYEDCDDYWCDYITDAENETHLNQGINVIQLKFDGEEIYKSKYDGKFVLKYLYLKKKEENSWGGYSWYTMDSIYDAAYMTSFYNYTQFEKGTSFADDYSDFGIDTNNNSLYDYLVINVSVYIEDDGDYKISGWLYEDCSDYYCDYVTYAYNETHLDSGTNIVQLKFDGGKIYKTKFNGNFVPEYLYLEKKVENYWGGYSWHIMDSIYGAAYATQFYNYTQFEKASEFIDNYADYGLDTNNNSLYDYLIINVTVYANEEGDYRISGELYEDCSDYWCDYVTYANNETHLNSGTNIVQLKFDGEKIYKTEFNGNFVLRYLSLYKKEESSYGGYSWDELDYRSIAYTTAAYNYTQFEKASEFTNNYSDYGIDLNNNSLYDYLVINVSIYINEEGDYRISGELYTKDSSSSPTDSSPPTPPIPSPPPPPTLFLGNAYITSDEIEAHLNQGINVVQLKFSGRKINQAEFNGNFVLKYLNLYKKEGNYWEGLDYKYGAYTTSSYNYTQFEEYKKLEGNFTGTYWDSLLDTNDNELADYFVINIEVNVSDYGKYEVYGYLYKGSCSTSEGCDYIYATNTTYLNSGTNIVQLKFDGRDIYGMQYDGKYVLKYLRLMDAEEWWGELDYKPVAYETLSRDYEDFERPPAHFTNNYSDSGLDTNNNSLYDYLIINVSVYAEEEGTYEISGSLYKNDPDSYSWNNYITSAENETHLNQGLNIVQLKFNGSKIFNTNYNGNYAIKNLRLRDSEWNEWDYRVIAYNTSYYNYTQFERPPIYFTGNYSDSGLDINNNSLYDYLVINVSVYASAAGEYKISGELYENCPDYWCNYITFDENETHLNQGLNIVQLKFDGSKIYKTGYNGSFVLKYLYLEEKKGDWWNTVVYKSVAYNTSPYNYTQFETPSRFTGSYSDFGIDLNNNSLYDYLVINVSVYASKEGDYKIYGYLYENCSDYYCDYITSATNETHLSQGLNVVQLKFDGEKIYKSKFNGNFVMDYLRLQEKEGYWWNTVDSKYTAYTTSNYNYTQFERSPGFTGNYSDFGIDLNNNSLYDYLVINVSVYLEEEGDYKIYGSLYENCSDYWCEYITNAENETHLNKGLNIVQLKFNGIEIYNSQYNGEFVLKYLSMYKEGYWWDEIDYLYTAYTTHHYNYIQFEKPPAKFFDEYSDFGQDTNNNSLYDYLVISVEIYVYDGGEGDYKLSGSLYEDCPYSWCDYITSAKNETHLNTGWVVMHLKFDGKKIHKTNYDGKFTLKFLTLEKKDGENWIESDYEQEAYTTSNYGYMEFEKPSEFTGNYSDFGLDTNNNSLYDYLIINVSVYADEDGKYKIYGDLYEDCSGYWCDYITSAENETYLKQGENIVQLQFDGGKIYKSEFNGKFVLDYLGLQKMGEYWWSTIDYEYDAYTTSYYNYIQFEKPPEFTGNYSDSGLDTNNNSLYEYLIINVSVYADEDGKYRIYGSLYEDCNSYYGCDFITSAENETYLNQGENIVQLQFDGGEIYKSEFNGKFVLKYLYLYKKEDGNWVYQDYEYKAYTTSYYNYVQFEKPSEFTGNYSDSGLDTNNNSLYEYLIINVSVYADEDGKYRIYGNLYEDCSSYWCDYITSAENETYLNQGENIVQLQFDGREIYKSEFNGNFVLEYLSLSKKEDGEWTWWDYEYKAYTTAYYNYTQFEKPPAKFTDNYTDYGLDTNYNLLYDYLVINISIYSETNGKFQVSGKIYEEDCQWWWACDSIVTAKNEINLTQGLNIVPLMFDGKKIYDSNYNGKFKLNELILLDEQGMVDYKEWNYANATSFYNHTQFEHPDVLITGNYDSYASGNYTAEDGLKYKFLTIEADLNVSRPGTYIISGELYDENGMYVSEYSMQVNLIIGINRISLKFSGEDIYKNEVSGKFLLKNLYVKTTSGEKSDNKESAYTSGWYNYVSFLIHTCDANGDGIVIKDYNDLMFAYKCFLGIEKNCDINYQDWEAIKSEYNCFVGL